MKKIIVLLVLAGAVAAIYYQFNQTATRPREALTLYGNIDIRQVQLSFHDPEHIAVMNVKEGERVKKGQVLAVQDLARFNYNLQAAQAKLKAQQSNVAKLEAGYRKEEIEKAKAEVAAIKSRVKFSEQELQRQKSLLKKSLASQESVDRAQAALDEEKAKLAALKAQYQLMKKGPREEDIAMAKAMLEAEKATVSLARQKLNDAHLVAPEEGIIRDRILEPGDMADGRTPVYTLALTNPLWARTYIPEKELGKIHPGQRAEIFTDSYPGKSYPAWVGFISPTAEFTPKSIETPELRTSLVYQMRVFVCNSDNELRLGMPVTVKIKLNQSATDSQPAGQCD